MEWILAAVAVWLAGGLLSLVAGRRARIAGCTGPLSVVIGGGLALVPSWDVLCHDKVLALRMAWDVPLGSFDVALDPLSALFAVPILVVSMLAAVYGRRYLRSYADRKNLGAAWCLFNLLVASMFLVVLARNGVLFLVSWEAMALASFFLVMFEAEKTAVRRAGWTYLVATHLGTAFLLAMFALLARGSNSLDFAGMRAEPGLAGLLFLLAVIGFGAKAGFFALHVWLPEAHPAAPSHVSAVMSGVMIKTGIYGLLRLLAILGPPPAWWGWTLVAIGVSSGVGGVLFALAQHHLKRLLAYHSVENIGIIALGMGLGLLGIHYGNPAMAALGLAGALLHVVNHAVFKSLLFLGAGSVLHGAGTGDIDELGGLLKRMPTTGLTFLVGAVAISGLPPLNGFISELLIYLAAFHGLTGAIARTGAVASALGIGALALIGGLAAARFAKAFGVVFLGEPRSPHAEHAHEAGLEMRFAMLVLALFTVLLGLLGPWIVPLLGPAIETIVPGGLASAVSASLDQAGAAMRPVCLLAAMVWTLVGVLAAARKRLLRGRAVERTVTWDCGYVLPSPRMQYTASSFARPITAFFRLFLRTRERIREPEGYFPSGASLRTETRDVFREGVYRPLFVRIAAAASRLRWLQHGRLQVYVLYIALTLLALLIWKLG